METSVPNVVLKEETEKENKKNKNENENEDYITNSNLQNSLSDYLKKQSIDLDLSELELYKENSTHKFEENKNNIDNNNNNKNKNNNNNNIKKTNSDKSIDKNSLAENLIFPIPLNSRLFNIKHIIGDKNSLYRAISESILESEDDYLMIKFFVANFAQQKNQIEELYNNFYMEEFSMNFMEYLERIKDDSFLVGELDLILISKVLNIELGIYTFKIMSQELKKNSDMNLNKDYFFYSSLKLVNFIKCKNPKFKIDILLNNLENANTNEKKTYHLITFNKLNPYYRHICERKNEYFSSLTEIDFYEIKEIENENVSFIRDFYFTNYIPPPEVRNLNELNDNDKNYKYNNRNIPISFSLFAKNKFLNNLFNMILNKFPFSSSSHFPYLFKYPKINLTDDVKLTLMVILGVLAFLTLRRLI
jgi:hypothetical protein